MSYLKKLVVFYRQYPTSLEAFIAADSKLSFTKDGAKSYLNHRVPRMSVFVAPAGNPVSDRKRVRDLCALLEAQVKLGLVLGYK